MGYTYKKLREKKLRITQTVSFTGCKRLIDNGEVSDFYKCNWNKHLALGKEQREI